MANPTKTDSLLADRNNKPLMGSQQTTVVNLTDNSGGTPSDTIAGIGVTYVQAEVSNAVASLAAKITALNAILEAHGLSADA